MTCTFAHFDGSYVLGALSPSDRQAFEEHLAGCPECARSVREFAGLPGLLARVDADAVEATSSPEPVSEMLLPALLREVRRGRRRRMLVSAGLAAAAVVTIAAGALALVDDGGGPAAPPGASAPAGVAMTAIQQDEMTARLAVEAVPWGTRLNLTCRYAAAGDDYGAQASATYAMFVRTRDGRAEQVATWRALPGETMRLTAATATRRDDIASVEVRTTGGTPVLRLR